MLMALNGRERTLAAFEELCKAVTPQLIVRKVYPSEQGELSLIEITRADGSLQAETNGFGH